MQPTQQGKVGKGLQARAAGFLGGIGGGADTPRKMAATEAARASKASGALAAAPQVPALQQLQPPPPKPAATAAAASSASAPPAPVVTPPVAGVAAVGAGGGAPAAPAVAAAGADVGMQAVAPPVVGGAVAPGVAVQQQHQPGSMAALLAGLRGAGVARGGGRRDEQPTATVAAQLKAHRRAIIQMDTRLRRREAAVMSCLAPELFPPIELGLDALDAYLAAVKINPDHGFGAPGAVIMTNILIGAAATEPTVGADAGAVARRLAIYMLADFALAANPQWNAEWMVQAQVARLPATTKRGAKTLLTFELVGDLCLPQPPIVAALTAAVVRAEAGEAVDFQQWRDQCFTLEDGIPSAPWPPQSRVHTLDRVLMSVLSQLGASKTRGPPPRGGAIIEVMNLKGKGKGKKGGRGRAQTATFEEPGDEDDDF